MGYWPVEDPCDRWEPYHVELRDNGVPQTILDTMPEHVPHRPVGFAPPGRHRAGRPVDSPGLAGEGGRRRRGH